MYLVASDYDGTLLINDEVSSEDIAAIQNFRALGHQFGICTGRPIDSIYEEVQKYKIPYDFIIGVNGAVAVLPNHQELFHHSLDQEEITAIHEILKDYHIMNYNISNGYASMNYETGEKESPDVVAFLAQPISGYYIQTEDSDAAHQLAEKINNTHLRDNVIAYANRDFVAIGVNGVHKANGIRQYLQVTDTEADVYTIGDDYNDIPMFKAFASYGIESGVPEALVYAKTLSKSVREVLADIVGH